VQRGDRIVGLGDLDLATASADEVKRALRGPVGEGVHVSLDRDGTPLEADLTFQDLLPEI
jgi:C-terminal processing protease CtpA/Prc